MGMRLVSKMALAAVERNRLGHGGLPGHDFNPFLHCHCDPDSKRQPSGNVYQPGRPRDLATAELIQFQHSLGIIDFDRETAAYVQQGIALDRKSENLRVQLETLNLEVSGLRKEVAKHHPAIRGAQQQLSQAILRYT